MKYAILFLTLCLSISSHFSNAQHMAPEGKIMNNRTLTWDDFLGRPTREDPSNAAAATQPCIYAVVDKDSVEELPNDMIKIKFKVKCAFQSASWVREGNKEHSDYLLNHEQGHYDIALTFANKLQTELDKKTYTRKNYAAEIDAVFNPIYDHFEKVEDDYDKESDHSLIHENQALWDMRIKKCLENNSDEFYYRPKDVVMPVIYNGGQMKRSAWENAVQFALRCRPMYAEFDEELTSKTMEAREWGNDKTVIAFYRQKYKKEILDEAPKEATRLLGYAMVPLGGGLYKRMLVDTFESDYGPTKIAAVFFANVDSDKIKELIVITTNAVQDPHNWGVNYTIKAYDAPNLSLPANKLKKMPEVNAKIQGGFEGKFSDKPSKAKCKTQKEVMEVLKKEGFS